MSPRRGGALGLALLGLAMGSAAASGRVALPRPVLIGALTESWGPTPAIVGLRDGLVALGHREHHDFILGVRFTQGDPGALPEAARQLVERGAHLLVTGGGGIYEAQALRAATDRLPIVFLGGSDPVGAGLVQSFARPGGNVTGVADLDVALVPKRLEIFRELVPGLTRVLLPYDASPGAGAGPADLARHRAAARRLGLVLVERPLRSADEAQAVLGAVRRGEVDGIVSPRYLSLNLPALIIEAGRRERLPTMLHASFHVEQGGLASYAADLYAVGRHAARLVDRILRGARPADVPVEQATRFELALNLGTARAIGLAVPPAVLLRADRLIQEAPATGATRGR